MDGISEGIEESSASIHEISTAEGMTAELEEVVTASQQLGQRAQDLKSAVDSFQMEQAD